MHASRSPLRRYLGNGPAEFYEYYMHAALVVEPPPRRVLRFSLGDGLVDDIFVDRDPAPDETMRQVIDRAVQYDSGHRLFRDPAIAPALEGSDGGGSEASASASVELAGGVADQPTSIETMSLQDFLGMTTEALLGRFSPDTNPIGIRVVVIQKEKSDDREVPETRSSKMPKLS